MPHACADVFPRCWTGQTWTRKKLWNVRKQGWNKTRWHRSVLIIYDIFNVCAFEWSSPNILRPGTLPSQHYNNNLFKKKIWLIFIPQQLHNVRNQIYFSGFKYYHNPKHSGPYTAERQGGGNCALEKTIFTIFRMSWIILRIFGTFFGI